MAAGSDLQTQSYWWLDLLLVFSHANRASYVLVELLAAKLSCWMMVAKPVFGRCGLLCIPANISAFNLWRFCLERLPPMGANTVLRDRWDRESRSCPLGPRLQSVWQFKQSLLIVDDMKVIDVGSHLGAALLVDAISWRERDYFTAKQQLISTEHYIKLMYLKLNSCLLTQRLMLYSLFEILLITDIPSLTLVISHHKVRTE